MQIHEATMHIVVFWALVVLTDKREKAHSQKKIADTIGHKTLSHNTIRKCLEYLEKHGAIVCNYRRLKRRGKRDLRYRLCPEKIPSVVVNATVSRTSEFRCKQHYEKSGLGKYKDGELTLDAEKLLELGSEVTVKSAEIFSNVNRKASEEFKQLTYEDKEQWLIDNLNGEKIEIDTEFLKMFHDCICWKVKNLYGDTNCK